METEKFQSKSVTPIDDYKCTLSEELIAILEKEIRETEEIRNFSIQAMREWTMQNPRIIRTRLDSMWLLKHLRFRKYSLPMAQETIERHLVIREGIYGHEQFHLEVDVLRPCVKKVFDVNPVCLLPGRDKQGRPVLFFRFRSVKPEGKCLLQDLMTAAAMLLESLSEIEEFQIRGMVYILDVGGIGPSYLKITPIENMIRIIRNAEACAVGRHKGLHIVNVPAAVSYVINIAIKSAPKKIRERVRIYSSFDQLDFIDKKFLPKEYGGTIPMKVLSDEIWQMMLKNRDLHLKYFDMKVDASKYPKKVLEGSTDMLKIPLSSPDLFERATRCNDELILGVQGSFRKLEID